MIAILACVLGSASLGAGPATFNKTVAIGTDVANLFVYHPDDLGHRLSSPDGWMYDDFACGAEFRAGTFLAWRTGGDGGFSVRFTDGDLTARERAHLGGSWRFRYHVGRGRTLLEGGYLIPSESPKRDKFREENFVEIPDGDYEVTLIDIGPRR